MIFHSDRGSTYTAARFTALCRKLGIRQSMGRVGSCFDNACAEAFFSSLEWEVLSRHDFETTRQAQAVVIEWCYGFYNHQRRHRAGTTGVGWALGSCWGGRNAAKAVERRVLSQHPEVRQRGRSARLRPSWSPRVCCATDWWARRFGQASAQAPLVWVSPRVRSRRRFNAARR